VVVFYTNRSHRSDASGSGWRDPVIRRSRRERGHPAQSAGAAERRFEALCAVGGAARAGARDYRAHESLEAGSLRARQGGCGTTAPGDRAEAEAEARAKASTPSAAREARTSARSRQGEERVHAAHARRGPAQRASALGRTARCAGSDQTASPDRFGLSLTLPVAENVAMTEVAARKKTVRLTRKASRKMPLR
jgi:hypothetical protein